jgi:hypothetical protein
MKPFWIKERYNPQLGTYYVACGQLSKTAAKKHLRPIYGNNIMHSFRTEESYKRRIAELEKAGHIAQ